MITPKFIFFVILFVFTFSFFTETKDTYAWATYGHKWALKDVKYYVNTNNADGLTPTAVLAGVQKAALAWNDEGQANIQLSYSGSTNGSSLINNGKNEIFFRDTGSSYTAQTYWWWDSTGKLVDADIVFHDNHTWFAPNTVCSGGYYISNTGAHEFGHVLGLLHSEYGDATMWGSTGGCDTFKETLHSDDIAGIQSIYGKSGGGAATSPLISLSPTSLSFNIISGDVPPSAKSVSLSNSGSGTLIWSALTDQSWCHVSPSSGSGNSALAVTVDSLSTSGNFICNMTVSDSNADNSPQNVITTYTVSVSTGPADNILPTVSITSPINAAIVARRSTTLIQALASDDVGVSNVEFYVGTTLVCLDRSAPYSCSWKVPNTPNKTYKLTAKVYDLAGNSNISASVNVTSGK
jgi:hypothetical protein